MIPPTSLSNYEIVTMAVFLLGGDVRQVDTEDIAVKANEIAPGRFTWRKYPNQISIDSVRKRIWDACQADKGALLFGSEGEGWGLTPAGLTFAKKNSSRLGTAGLERRPMNAKERNWQRRERERMLCTDAFAKFSSNRTDDISLREAEEFFRVDAYVTGDTREQKIMRAVTAFGSDDDLRDAVTVLAEKVRKGEKQ